MFAGLLIWMIILIRFWISGKARSMRIRNYPSITSILFLSIAAFLVFGAPRYNSYLIEPGVLSIALMLASLLCAMTSVWSIVVLIRSRKEKIGKVTFLHMGILSGLHVLATLYLFWHGVFPVMTWS
jgi:hypothetical protein